MNQIIISEPPYVLKPLMLLLRMNEEWLYCVHMNLMLVKQAILLCVNLGKVSFSPCLLYCVSKVGQSACHMLVAACILLLSKSQYLAYSTSLWFVNDGIKDICHTLFISLLFCGLMVRRRLSAVGKCNHYCRQKRPLPFLIVPWQSLYTVHFPYYDWSGFSRTGFRAFHNDME